jgi:hypothetical protein
MLHLNSICTLRWSLSFLALPLLQACSIFGGSQPGLQRVDALLGRTERLHVACEAGKQRTEAAVTALHTLVTGTFGDQPALAHQRLLQAIKSSQEQADELAASIESVRSMGEPCFEQWALDLQTMQSLELRQRSQARLTETRTRYQAVLDTAGPALVAFKQLNQHLQDQALFLGYDYNQDSVAALAGDVGNIRKEATYLSGTFDACLAASLRYVQSAAPPTPAPLPER